MGRERGWVSVSVRTYHSHRSQQQQQNQSRVMQQDYTVDESGATLNAVSRSSDASDEQQLMQQMAAAANSNAPTTSIFIRDWKVRPCVRPRLPLCSSLVGISLLHWLHDIIRDLMTENTTIQSM